MLFGGFGWMLCVGVSGIKIKKMKMKKEKEKEKKNGLRKIEKRARLF